VNQTVLEYLRLNKGRYDLDKLKNKILTAGYSQEDVDEALMQLEKETESVTPTVIAPQSTRSPIQPVNQFLGQSNKSPSDFSTPVSLDSSSRSIKWLVITLIIAIFILIGVGIASWYFLLR
jgi:hypothetical protein